MTETQPLIDYKELISSVKGEGLEQLVRHIGLKKGLSPVSSGRGADEGRDLYFTEILSGPISIRRVKWVVSCKDKALSGSSVTEKELPTIKDKLIQHKADGFLLVTTTTVSTGSMSLLDGLYKENGGDIYTRVWDASELTAILLEESNHDLLRQFLPESYKRVKGLTSLGGAILAFREQLPKDVLSEVERLLRPYSGPSLKGSSIWPGNPVVAAAIDSVIKALFTEDSKALLTEDSVSEAVRSTEGIELDAFMALTSALHDTYPEVCFSYLSQVIAEHSDTDIVYNAYQFLSDSYPLTRRDILELTPYVDDESSLIESDEVVAFVKTELIANIKKYKVYGQMEELFGAIEIEDVEVTNILYEIRVKGRIHFFGWVKIGAVSGSDRIRHEVLCELDGYFDEHDIYLESVYLDTRLSEGKGSI
jgi:hypothetical protein